MSAQLPPIEPERFALTFKNSVGPAWPPGVLRRDIDISTSAEATILVDGATYDLLDQRAPYTVEMTHDFNPWHRSATTFGQRLRRLRDGLIWTFRRGVLRQDLVETISVTVPGCTIETRPA